MKKLLALAAVLFSGPLLAGSATLAWTAPTQYDDGSVLPLSEIQSYKIYYGTAPRTYTGSITVAANATSYTVSNLTSGVTYYFAVTTIATNLEESVYSNEGTKVIPKKKPNSPTNLR